ncbi:MAG TPA: GNAT family N-acetyltransferase [Candidatus Saccharimonadales bacterium]|nr:GNAT family N-acetyltransferase [Candidatus Saccharimonadales bacterium]
MNINLVTEKSDALKRFEQIEWPIADKEHYGTADVDFTTRPFYLSAEDNGEILGIIQGKIQGGVCTINDLIVAHNRRGQGIGTELMAKIEEYAVENKAHKIRLVTGDGWPAIKFYEKLSYKETARRPNDMQHTDFIEYTKFI